MSAPASYRHSQAFTAMWLGLPLPVLAVTVMALANGDAALLPPLALAWGMLAVGLLGFGRLVIELRADRLHWTFGYLGWPRWELTLAEIELVQCVRTSAWRGAGIKGLGKDKLFSASIGGPAVRLGLLGGRIVTLGSPEPERLAAFIEARRPPRR